MKPCVSSVASVRNTRLIGGVEDVQDCLGQLHSMRYEILNTGLKRRLVQGLLAIGQFSEALTLIDAPIVQLAHRASGLSKWKFWHLTGI